MSKILYPGSWFLKVTGDRTNGHILINGNKITLEIYSSTSIEGNKISGKPGDAFAYYHPLILGESEGRKISLYSCSWAEIEYIGHDIYLLRYEVAYCFLGCHFFDSNIKVRSGRFTIPHLASWYDGQYIFDKMPIVSHESFPSLIEGDQGRDVVRISSILEIAFEDYFQKNFPSIGFHHAVKYDKHFNLLYSKEVSFDNLLDDASKFLQLMQFSCGKPLKIKILDVGIIEQPNINLKEHSRSNRIKTIIVQNTTLNKGKEVEQDSRHCSHMIISRWNLKKSDLHKAIVNWFSNTDYYVFYDFYVDSNNWFQGTGAIISNVMFNNRFLNLVQGLEGYCNKFKERQDDESFENRKQEVLNILLNNVMLYEWMKVTLKKPNITLREKLTWVLDRFRDDLKQIFSQSIIANKFIDYATKTRNELSHLRNKKTNLGHDLYANFYFGRIMLAICILDSLKVERIAEKINAYTEFENNIRFIETQLGVNEE